MSMCVLLCVTVIMWSTAFMCGDFSHHWLSPSLLTTLSGSVSPSFPLSIPVCFRLCVFQEGAVCVHMRACMHTCVHVHAHDYMSERAVFQSKGQYQLPNHKTIVP
jgi:hypothetical protein